MSKWTEKMRREYAHIPVLSKDEIQLLPEADDYDAGIYFLWKNGEVQYIGKSTQISYRLTLQEHANTSVDRKHSIKKIIFDRHTALVLDSGRIHPPGLGDLLRSYERAYIAAYEPPLNCLEQNPGT